MKLYTVRTLTPADFTMTCYACHQPVTWLAPDSRCKDCTQCTIQDVTGEENI